jgi:acetyl esterase/lipase
VVTYSGKLRMEIHTPASAGPHPVVIFLPGGGFARALWQLSRAQRSYVADQGFVVASVEYRTALSGAMLADGIDDARAAIRWLAGHAEEVGADLSGGVALWGESAGAYLSVMTALTTSAGGVPPIVAVIDQFGASDLSRITEGFDDKSTAAFNDARRSLAKYIQGPGRALDADSAVLEAANPLTHLDGDLPAFLLLHGDDDRIISPHQTALLHQALVAAGAESTRYVIPGAGHGDLAAESNSVKIWSSRTLLDLSVDFLRKHLAK